MQILIWCLKLINICIMIKVIFSICFNLFLCGAMFGTDIKKIPRSLNPDSMFCPQLGTANKQRTSQPLFARKFRRLTGQRTVFAWASHSFDHNHWEFIRLCHVYLGNIQFTGILLPSKSVNILRMRNC